MTVRVHRRDVSERFSLGAISADGNDSADSIDGAREASTQGMRALKISLLVVLGTTILQFAVVLTSGSVASPTRSTTSRMRLR